MLYLDYVQPSIDGQPLAIARYRLRAGERVWAIGLVRCSAEVLASVKNWSLPTKAYLGAANKLSPPRAKFSLSEVSGAHRPVWESFGFEVLDHRLLMTNYSGQREYEDGKYRGHVEELLRHPQWVVTGEQWELSRTLIARKPTVARKRL